MIAGAVASSGGARFSVHLRVLSLPRPGVAHRTIYRVNRSELRDLGELFSLSQPSFHFATEGRGGLDRATSDAPLTGEATLGGQTSSARMTALRPFGGLCLTSLSTSRLTHPFPNYNCVLTNF